jgi:hypothetical protein
LGKILCAPCSEDKDLISMLIKKDIYAYKRKDLISIILI